MKILAIPGSLRRNSSSNVVLKYIISALPKSAIVTIAQIDSLPHFDDPTENPPVVTAFRESIAESDLILICTPEYAFGIPGSLKNALDWTVGSGEFLGKPVSVITASSSGEHGHAALLLVLQALSAKVLPDASLVIRSVRSRIGPDGQLRDEQVINSLRRCTAAMADHFRNLE
jgi:chromate reductase, NAD(P)H dehydrogenase (quinone)